MGRKALIAVLWLASAWNATSLITDNDSAESAPRLYRNVGQGVYASAYASAAPYGAFSFHVPTVVPASKATQLIPVKQESIVIQNSGGFLKDSYGNQFVETPQSVAYKTTFPQQYVQLQHLPAHLSQPLAAAPRYAFPQGPPQAFFGAQYRLPSIDAVTSPLTRYGTIAQPFVYGNVKSLTPASDQQFYFGTPAKALQEPSNNRVVYAPHHSFNQLQQNDPKFQRLEEKPQNEYYEAPRQQAAPSLKAKVQAPVKHTVKTTHNGQDTVVHLETKPPLPLLDLSLLEPLTFANPIVPQVQHYLPKINALTYSKLHPQDDVQVKNHNKEFVIQKTKSYDSGLIKGKPHSDEPKRKQKKPPKDTEVHINYESKSEKPSIKVKGTPNDPGYSYEINSPGYKESYNQQVVSYNKETQNDPVTYTYQKKTQKEPVTYSYSHSSKDPGQTKVVHYVKKDPQPNHLVYNFQPEQDTKHHESPNAPEESDDTDESSESDDDSYDHAEYNAQPHHDNPHSHPHPTQSSHTHHSTPTSHSHHSTQSSHSHHSTPSSHSHHPTPSSYSHHSTPSSHSHHSTPSSHSHHPTPSSHSHHSTPSSHSSHSDHSHPSTHSHQSYSQPSSHSHSSSTAHPSTHLPQSQHLKVEHKGQINQNPTPAYYVVSQKPQYYTHAPVAATPKFPTLNEYVENLRFIPSYPSPLTSAAIRVDPNQHLQNQQQRPVQYFVQQTTPRARSEGAVESEPVIYEKSKKIIIQEESPDEVHSHQEKLTAQMVGQEENSEEDFEKSYKEAAYGFPAYDRDSSAESEEEIYNHNYGEPQSESRDESGHSPFEQYTEEGDEFPKSARLSYKDDRNKMQDDYYLGFSLNKPEIMTDRYQSKINYYKMFLKNKPQELRASDAKKKTAKYTVEPSFFDSAPKQKSKQSAPYKSAPTYGYSYDKESRDRDSSAYASRPLRYKSKTHFVEPTFQYGFEPISIPRLDSELESMASNVSPESEAPGTRKKVYKENWYIKKTSTSSKPS